MLTPEQAYARTAAPYARKAVCCGKESAAAHARRKKTAAPRAFEAAAHGDSLDWKDLSAGEICSRVMKGVQPGSIVLFHNAAKHTPEALPAVIENLLSEGYEIVPVSQLLLDCEYEMDHTGRMCPKGSV